MADRPLRPATHRSLGEPLPHQQANGPRAHPDAEAEASFPTTVLRPRGTFGISPSFLGLSQSSGHVTHVLLTRSRLCPGPKPGSSLHLHVLGTPPAFVLSQDQTLREELHKELSGIPLAITAPRTMPRNLTSKTWVSRWCKRPSPHARSQATFGSSKYTRGAPETRRVQSWRRRSIGSRMSRPTTASNLDTLSAIGRPRCACC